jgi:hypothetical protein
MVEMKLVKHLIFSLVLIGGMSVASMAQKGGDQKPPPKNPPPVINPGKGNPTPAPKGGDKPKKPGGGTALVIKRDENLIYSA